MNKHLVFKDLYDFHNYAFGQSNARKKSSRAYADKWSGGLDWKASKSLALQGWQEGLNKVDQFQVRISELLTSKIIRHKPVYAVAGNYIDIGSYLSNDPECFITREYDEEHQEGKIISIVCSISFSAAIEPETIIQRGAMICALVDAVEYAGYRAEVICNDASSRLSSDKEGNNKENGWFEVDVTVKKANQPLNRIELAFCLAHPAMLRRLLFSVAEIEGWSDYAQNYGYPATATNKGDLYIEELFSGVISDSKAIDWIISELEKLGVRIDNE